MPPKLNKFCKKCNKETSHRKVTSSPSEYWHCCSCSEKNSKRHRHKYWLRYIAQKANARKRPGSDKITEAILKDIWNKQNGRCALTGVPLETSGGSNSSSIDRINSDLGYTMDNTRLTTWGVNHIRGNLTDAQFTQTCKILHQHQANKELLFELQLEDLLNYGGVCGL